jgi:uncharacterized protein (DUF433 family)
MAYAAHVIASSSLVGKGIYSVPHAARLSKVTPRRIRYWIEGRDSESRASVRSPGLWTGQHEPIDNKIVLGFLDLQEVRFVDAFLKQGVSWPFLRRAHEIAKNRYKTDHPFCTLQFVTDGKHIIEILGESGHAQLEEIVHGQRVFPTVIEPFIRDLEFSQDKRIARWWPLGIKRRVVLDPARQFGQPIVAQAGVPTEVLFLAVKSGTSEDEVARWYEVSRRDVEDAVEFEKRLAA